MRYRSIKPDFWRSATLAAVTRDARLLFIGLWNYCDDEGRGLDEPRLIKGDLYPLDDEATGPRITRWLDELVKVGLVIRYTGPDGRHLLQVRSFAEHQRVERPQVSKLPAPPLDQSPSPHRGLTDPSVSDQRCSSSSSSSSKVVGEESKVLPTSSGGAHAPHRNGAASFEQIQAHLAHSLAAIAAGNAERVTAEAMRQLQAELIFAYWQAKLGHTAALMDRKRTTRLLTRLRENHGNVHELLHCVDGALKDDFIMGRNEQKRRYDAIETIYRDRAQVERLSALGGYREGGTHKMAEKYLSPPAAAQ